MPQQDQTIQLQQEGRVKLTIQAFNSGQFQNLRRAAAAFNVRYQLVYYQYNRREFRPTIRANSYKLTLSKEQTIVRYILNLNSRGFPPQLCEVADMADKILGVRNRKPISK